jgi:hypothetical protein
MMSKFVLGVSGHACSASDLLALSIYDRFYLVLSGNPNLLLLYNTTAMSSAVGIVMLVSLVFPIQMEEKDSLKVAIPALFSLRHVWPNNA